MNIESEESNQTDFYPFVREIGAYLRNTSQVQNCWEDFKESSFVSEDTRPLTVKGIANIQTRTLAFTETQNKVIFAFTTALKPQPGEVHLQSVEVHSFSKADGTREKKRICEIRERIICTQMGLSTIKRREIISLVVGVEDGTLYFFAFDDQLICSSLKILSFPITQIRYCPQNDYFQSRNIIVVSGQDQSIVIVNCQSMTVVAHLKQGNIPSRKPVSLFFSESCHYLMHGLSDGCIQFWSITKPLRDKIHRSHSKPENKYHGVRPKYSLSSAALKGLVAVEGCNGNLMLLTTDNHLKLICVDISDNESYLTFFDYKIQSEATASSMQIIEEKCQVVVSVETYLLVVSFNENGVTAVKKYILPATSNMIVDRFVLSYEDQSYIGVVAQEKFFIGQIAKPKSSLKQLIS